MSAAFVDQDIFHNDLSVLGIDGLLLEWFRKNLKNRKIRVCVIKPLCPMNVWWKLEFLKEVYLVLTYFSFIQLSVDRCMRSTRFEFNSKKKQNIVVWQQILVCIDICIDINSVVLGNLPKQLSNSVRTPGFVFENQLDFEEEISNVKMKVHALRNSMTKSKKWKYFMVLFFFSTIVLCNTLY